MRASSPWAADMLALLEPARPGIRTRFRLTLVWPTEHNAHRFVLFVNGVHHNAELHALPA